MDDTWTRPASTASSRPSASPPAKPAAELSDRGACCSSESPAGPVWPRWRVRGPQGVPQCDSRLPRMPSSGSCPGACRIPGSSAAPTTSGCRLLSQWQRYRSFDSRRSRTKLRSSWKHSGSGCKRDPGHYKRPRIRSSPSCSISSLAAFLPHALGCAVYQFWKLSLPVAHEHKGIVKGGQSADR